MTFALRENMNAKNRKIQPIIFNAIRASLRFCIDYILESGFLSRRLRIYALRLVLFLICLVSNRNSALIVGQLLVRFHRDVFLGGKYGLGSRKL